MQRSMSEWLQATIIRHSSGERGMRRYEYKTVVYTYLPTLGKREISVHGGSASRERERERERESPSCYSSRMYEQPRAYIDMTDTCFALWFSLCVCVHTGDERRGTVHGILPEW